VIADGDRRSTVLWKRLDEHRDSIEQAGNLEVADFRCRWLVADMLFVPMAESLMIQTYHPLWNLRLDGFGNHDPGKGRYNQERSPWDTLHEGRYWAPRQAEPPYTAAELRYRVALHLNEHPPEEAPVLPPVTQVAVIEVVADEEED
jgi:hypothetical protein